MRGCTHPLHLGVEILQSLNDMEDLQNCHQVFPAHGKEVLHNKGKGYQGTEQLIYGWDGSQEYPSGFLKGIRGGRLVIHIFCQEGGVLPHTG